MAAVAFACSLASPVRATLPPAAPFAADGATPNVIMIVMDDLGYGDLGVYGATYIRTPGLDAIAAEGLQLMQYYANGSTCSPSRASLLGGNFPISYGLDSPLTDDSRRGIAAATVTLAEVLQAGGYVTGHVGKWHLSGETTDPGQAEFFPPAAGFSTSVRLLLDDPGGQDSHWNPRISLDERSVVEVPGHDTTVLTDYALDFLDKNGTGASPFFLNLWYFAPHIPAEAPQAYIDAYDHPDPDDWTAYAAMVSHLDASIASIVDRVDALGIAAQTLIIITSDNGGTQANGIHPDGNGGLAGFKGEFLEGGLRVPFLVRQPGFVPAGITDNSVITGVDLFPTVLDVLGLGPPPSGLPGRNAREVFTGGPLPYTENFYWSGRASLNPFDPPGGIVDAFAVRQDLGSEGGADWKLVFQRNQSVALFDLDSDPGEVINRLNEFPAQAQALWDAHWAHRRLATRLGWTGELRGMVRAIGTGYGFGGGTVTIPADARFDFHDGNFTARMGLRPRITGEQVIAIKPGSWELALDQTNRLRLTVEADDGKSIILTSTSVLAPGQSSVAGFTATSWHHDDSDIALFVNGVREAGATIPAVRTNREPVYLGNDAAPPAGTRPYRGRMTGIEFYAAALVGEEFLGAHPPMP